jgi:hypothetical protein
LAFLQDFGERLVAALPLKLCCNHPSCTTMNKIHEEMTACITCATCSSATYCSNECRVAHWDMHKKACKRLR